jgi:hypothetical protein
MHDPMRPLATLLALLALVAGSSRALAAPFAPPAPPAGVVQPGAMVVTALPPLPAGAREFELFLLPDSGTPIRVSAELPAGAREVRWRMPAVAAGHARLVLRAGGEHFELESAPSASFALARLPADELLRVLRGRSEAGARIESCAGAAATGLSAAANAPSLSPGSSLAYVAERSPAPIPAPGESAVARMDAATRDARPANTLHARSNTPAFTPLRN